MKITASYEDGIAHTSIPCIKYDMSAKEYDAQLLALSASIVAACAENIGDGDEELTMTALTAIADCAKMMLTQGEYKGGRMYGE